MRRLTSILAAAALAMTLGAASASPASAEYGLETVGASLSTSQAGGHPDFVTNFKLNLDGTGDPFARTRDTFVDLPPGLIGNPSVVEQCNAVQFQAEGCPQDSQVGLIEVDVLGLSTMVQPVFELEPTKPNVLARLGFIAGPFQNTIDIRLRSAGKDADYGLTAAIEGTTSQGALLRAVTTIWAVPADESHDLQRIRSNEELGYTTPRHSGLVPKPFMINPTACGDPLSVGFAIDSYLQPGVFSAASAPLGTITGCDALDFSPTIQARPTTNAADSPSGLDFDLHIPQAALQDPEELAEATLKDATVVLPEGLVINPSGANGLDGCSPSQIGLLTAAGQEPRFNGAHPSCPDASKLGTVEVDTPLLDHPIPGAVYAATPKENPFNSLLAIYILLDDPQSNLIVKLAGHVQADPVTGQLTTTFAANPPLIFEDFKLHFFGGATAALRTPPTCATYTTEATLTPHSAPASGPPATPSDTYSIDASPTGGACPTTSAARPNAPSFDAGALTPIAGTYTPFLIHLRRADGSQEFSKIDLTPPPGLTAKLAGTPPCPEAALLAAAQKSGREEEAAPSCPAAAQIGTVSVGAGAGPAPYYAKGTAYLTGPYKGAPLGMAIITPATAGPYDLGTVLSRVALRLDPASAQISAEADPIPEILEGIPLDVRRIDVAIDRPGFSRTGTSCDPFAVAGQLLSTLGQAAALRAPFQLGECGRLAFKPKLALALKGGTKRGAYQQLRATLTAKEGEANIASTQVTFPHSTFLAQEHIRTVCTRVQFAAHACPPGSVYGHATALTPLLDQPLSGPVYLRSSNHTLPDLVVALKGPEEIPIEVELAGRNDSKRGGIRNSFEVVPDAPVTKFTLTMLGGKKSLLVNSRDLCNGTQRASVSILAQNGARLDSRPLVHNSCKAKAKKKRGR